MAWSLSLTGNRAEFGERLEVFRFPSYIKHRDKHSNQIMLLLLNVKLRIFRKYLKKNSWHSVITAVSIESLAVRKNDRKVNKYNDGIVLVEINQASSCGIFGKKFHHRNCKLNCMKFLSQFSVYHTEFWRQYLVYVAHMTFTCLSFSKKTFDSLFSCTKRDIEELISTLQQLNF